jgi:hypothetical protein
MIDAIATTRALPWPTRPAALPRRRTRVLAPGTRARAAARHGLRGALQTLVLAASLMAAVGAVGSSRAPVELNQPPAHTGAVVVLDSAGLAARGTSR